MSDTRNNGRVVAVPMARVDDSDEPYTSAELDLELWKGLGGEAALEDQRDFYDLLLDTRAVERARDREQRR